jgi:hypothetical protein
MFNPSSLMFEFHHYHSAQAAIETLKELGYETQLVGTDSNQLILLHNSQRDLSTTFEIVQFHGGSLVEQELTVPAHTINEDWPPGYAEGTPEVMPDQLL